MMEIPSWCNFLHFQGQCELIEHTVALLFINKEIISYCTQIKDEELWGSEAIVNSCWKWSVSYPTNLLLVIVKIICPKDAASFYVWY